MTEQFKKTSRKFYDEIKAIQQELKEIVDLYESLIKKLNKDGLSLRKMTDDAKIQNIMKISQFTEQEINSKEFFNSIKKMKQLNDILLQENMFLKKEVKSMEQKSSSGESQVQEKNRRPIFQYQRNIKECQDRIFKFENKIDSISAVLIDQKNFFHFDSFSNKQLEG